MNEPQSEHARYAYGFTNKKPSWRWWIIQAIMVAIALYSCVSVGHAQAYNKSMCGPWPVMKDWLFTEAGEVPILMVTQPAQNNMIKIITVNVETGTATFLQVDMGGIACTTVSGEKAVVYKVIEGQL